ncbi:MAG: MATE family efflux transporter [Sphingomonadaceae bacterium]|nr:MATE family efflux transporter [Sphingomonadaceae bacterium]
MLSNVATALFGLADMWVIGRLGDAPAQGAVELGAKFMMGLFTVFSFLRIGTIALTAQAAGRGDSAEQAAALTRSLAAAVLIGLVLLLFKPLAIGAGISMLEAEGQIAEHARQYIDVRYWAGTAWLANAVLIGWLIGQRRVKTVLIVEILANAVHIALDLLFVLGFDWGVVGVAWATVSSELLKLALLAILVAMVPASRSAWASARLPSTWSAAALRRLFSLNRDLFFRTLLLTGAMLIFARSGAQQGPVILAANGILFQIFMLSALILDGFESSTQVLCGEAKGAGDKSAFTRTVRVSLFWGVMTGFAISAAYTLVGDAFAASFSTDSSVVSATADYMWWVTLLPILGVVSFVLDGVFVGAGWSRAMLMTMATAMAAYCAMIFGLAPVTNDTLWLAFGLFFVIRAAGQLIMMPSLVRSSFSSS